MNYKDWENSVPEEISRDSLWKMTAYRVGLLLSDLCWHDATKLLKDDRTKKIADQLYRSVGSISANLAEGYSRGTGKDRARFYEYALGSARESRDWYYKSRYTLGETVTQHRLSLIVEIIRLLLTIIPQQRKRTLREGKVGFTASTNDLPKVENQLQSLLENLPLPK